MHQSIQSSRQSQVLDLSQGLKNHKYCQILKTYEEVGKNTQLFDRIEILNKQIITNGLQCKIIDQDFKFKYNLNLKSDILHNQNNQLITLSDINNSMSVVIELENNEILMLNDIYKANAAVQKIIDLDADIFICGLSNGQIQLFSIQNQQYSQVFQLNQLTCIREICLIKRQLSEYTLAFGDGYNNGISISIISKKGDYDYHLKDQQILIQEGQVLSIMLVKSSNIIEDGWFSQTIKESHTIAYTDRYHHCLKIFESGSKKQIQSIKFSRYPHIFAIQDYDYESNPFAYVKDEDKISLINLKTYQIVKIIDSKFNHWQSWNKNGSLIKIINENAEQIYRIIDLQRYNQSVEIREITINLSQITKKS